MLLKSLELQGFKTFPEKTTLSFNNGITAIVGPNGSGKSNISDAIRWVLGEQSIKTLRCTKMEDIIFCGTPNKNPKGFAQITLTIENADKKLPFDSDEVAIRRRYYRSGESEYFINNEDVRLKDIHELFMDTGLGRDGYSIISQGKIDSIVSAKSEDRREIFEEAAGISKYRYKKSEAEKKLAKAEENLLRLNDILSELEGRIGPLLEQSQKAQEYLDLSNKHKSMQIGVWLSILEQSGDLLKGQDSKLEISKNQYNEIEIAAQNIVDETDHILEKIKDYNLQVDEKRRSISECEETSIRKAGEISVFKNDILHNEENIERIKGDIEKINFSFSDITGELEKNKENIEALKRLELERKTEADEYRKALDSLIRNLGEFSFEIEKTTKNLSELNNKASSLNIGVLTKNAAVKDFESRVLNFSEELTEKEEELKSTEKLFLSAEKEIENQKTDLDEKINIAKNFEEKLKLQQEKNETQKKEIEKLKFDYEDQVRKIRLLENLEQNLEGFAQGVKFIMKESENGKLSGICGPVSRIIEVPKKYSMAIETALLSAMQNIVVETDDDAKKAIFALKNKNIGRATFLPVSTICGRELNENGLKNCAGFVGIASELCSSDKKYKGILDYLLGRVVVVDNLDNAVLISKKFSYRFKVVTIDGQVVNAGGSLTGGSKGKNSGLLSRASDIEEAKKLAGNLNLKLKGCTSNFESSVSEERILKEKLLQLNEEIAKKRQNKAELEAVCKNYLFRVDSIKNAIAKMFSEKGSIEKKIIELNKQKNADEVKFNDALSAIKFEEEKMAQLDTKRADIDIKKEEINKKIYEANLNVFSVKKEIEVLEQSLSDIEDKKVDKTNQVISLQNEMKSLQSKNEEIEGKIESINNDITLLKESVEVSKQKIVTINSERMNLEKKTTELRVLEREKSNEKEKVSLEIARLQDKRDNLQSEYDEIIGKLWDEYELTRREAMGAFEKIENTPKVLRQLNELRLKIRNLGTVNVAAIDEYKEVSSRYEFLKGQIDDVEKSKKELYRLITDLTSQMKSLFSERFEKINENFNLIFRELFAGGSAKLRMTDPSDVLNSGIEIFVQPPGKIVTHLEALSGGEKAFVSIALYFAIMKVNPAPFCVLDEIEAALDEANVDRFASYLRKMNGNTQFIVISHRRGTMEEADVLYGVTMQNEGISKLLELKASEMAKEYV
ncbi:MAG: Chromosome partition protein Smc [Eubacteriales bacterium SKADARSKE-1]|nr:Chromosome partition protein Smc [Eubacteriales bacterium SKADARSKE-1]